MNAHQGFGMILCEKKWRKVLGSGEYTSTLFYAETSPVFTPKYESGDDGNSGTKKPSVD